MSWKYAKWDLKSHYSPLNVPRLLKSIKPNVQDIHSVSALHYLNGGDDTLLHFQFLIISILTDINNYALSEMNRAYATFLCKEHGKDKSVDQSYQKISTWALLEKCSDKYIGQLLRDNWSTAHSKNRSKPEACPMNTLRSFSPNPSTTLSGSTNPGFLYVP